MKAWFNLGSVGFALSTTAERLSGITVRNTPPKNRQAASHPSITAAVVPVGADLLHQQGNERVGELLLAAVPVQTQPDRRAHVTADGLAVGPDQPLACPQPLPPEPHPENFTNLEHAYLPEGHRRSSI